MQEKARCPYRKFKDSLTGNIMYYCFDLVHKSTACCIPKLKGRMARYAPIPE